MIAEQIESNLDLFISFAEADAQWVESYFVPVLTGLGVHCHAQVLGLTPAALRATEKGITNAAKTVLILSHAYMDHPAGEQTAVAAVSHSLQRQTYSVIPLFLESVAVGLFLSTLNSIQMTDAYRWPRSISRLLQVVPRSLPPTPDAAIESLSSTDPTKQLQAATILGLTHEAAAVTPLLDTLSRYTPNSGASVAEDAVGPVVAGDLRRTIAQALGMIGDHQAIPALIEQLTDPVSAARRAAVAALGRFKDPQAAPVLAQWLTDSDPLVRETAVRALGYSHTPQTIAAIEEALKDTDQQVREAAAQSLKQLGQS